MSYRFSTPARAATLSMALAFPIATMTYANDEYGTGHEAVIQQAAASTPSAPLSVAQTNALNDAFKVGQNDAFGAARSSQLAPVNQNYNSRLASMSATAGNRDLVGAGGAQDQIANQIYHPGTGTDW
ncbi:MAG TPA: hypothetical protein VJO12_06170 [Stellaceae bacterium]|nr:hypothetical protein [Stellaceae bacterium]